MFVFKHKRGEWVAETSSDSKRIFVSGPTELCIEIDHDDVNTTMVEKETKKLLDVLHEHWK